MTKRATQRPEGFTKPAHWSSEPPPAPAKLDETALQGDGDHAVEGERAGKVAEYGSDEKTVSPTRYGDWTSNGIAIDF
ncbi:MAG: DUF1674 domain-containing protein [Alteripontixanthobacter sp.]